MPTLLDGTLIDEVEKVNHTNMNLESPKVVIDKTASETFEFLSDVKNFEALMPENINKFEILEANKFLFALKGMPEIVLKKRESIPNEKIVLGSGGGKLDFSLTANITSLEENKSEVNLLFDGEFNPMMAMMIKGPISKFIETLVHNMKTAI